MLCEVPGCSKRIRIIPGMGVVCEDGHAYHSMRYQTAETTRTITEPDEDSIAHAVHVPARSSPFLMPFGKHAGKPVEDLPSSYIGWLLENAHSMRDDLRRELEAQMEMRSGRGVVRTAARVLGHASTRPSRSTR